MTWVLVRMRTVIGTPNEPGTKLRERCGGHGGAKGMAGERGRRRREAAHIGSMIGNCEQMISLTSAEGMAQTAMDFGGGRLACVTEVDL